MIFAKKNELLRIIKNKLLLLIDEKNEILGIGYLEGKVLSFEQVRTHVVDLYWSSSFDFGHELKNDGCCGDVAFSFIGEGDFGTDALANSACKSDFKLESRLRFNFEVISFEWKILTSIIFNPVADSSKGFVLKFYEFGDCLSKYTAKDNGLLFRNVVR